MLLSGRDNAGGDYDMVVVAVMVAAAAIVVGVAVESAVVGGRSW